MTGAVPSDETGPGASFATANVPNAQYSSETKGFTSSPKKNASVHVREQSTGSSTETNPFRRSNGEKSSPTVHSRQVSGSSHGHHSRASADLRREAFAHDSSASQGLGIDNVPQRRSAEHSRVVSNGSVSGGHHRRTSSLRKRYPGDNTDHPLAMLEHDNQAAMRSPHLKRHHIPRPDTVDQLDDAAFGQYHHEGPYDAALFVRNTSYRNSPVAATGGMTQEALKATPKDKIKDSLNDHRPLDGTSIVPPGMQDQFGDVYNYEEGADLMRDPMAEGGPYRRMPGVTYLPEDLKGKGEPSYSIEKALKDHEKIEGEAKTEPGSIELVERPRDTSSAHRRNDSAEHASGSQTYADWEQSHNHSQTGGLARMSGELKRRVGSLRRKDKT